MPYSNKYWLKKKYKELTTKEKRKYNNDRQKLCRCKNTENIVKYIVSVHDDVSWETLDDIMETLQDMWLLNIKWRAVRHMMKDILLTSQE